MRMWMVDPSVLCHRHLLGEHVECHMFRGSLRKGRSHEGFLAAGILDSRLLAQRHDELAAELARRGYRHASPLARDFDEEAAVSTVDVRASERELAQRCEACRELQAQRRVSVPEVGRSGKPGTQRDRSAGARTSR